MMREEKKSAAAGFTLVELLIVFSVMALMAGIGFISLRDFSDRQVLATTTKDFASALRLARSQALSQVKPGSCGDEPLTGYRVDLTCKDTLCAQYTGYTVSPVCGATTQTIAHGNFPEGVAVTTTTSALIFELLTGMVARPDNGTEPTEIRFAGKTDGAVIVVYPDGRITSPEDL
jgi:Tfp pilus assembly protein FimT